MVKFGVFMLQILSCPLNQIPNKSRLWSITIGRVENKTEGPQVHNKHKPYPSINDQTNLATVSFEFFRSETIYILYRKNGVGLFSWLYLGSITRTKEKSFLGVFTWPEFDNLICARGEWTTYHWTLEKNGLPVISRHAGVEKCTKALRGRIVKSTKFVRFKGKSF